MQTFRETFELAESKVRPLLMKSGFVISKLSVTEKSGTQWVRGVARYVEKRRWFHVLKKRRFIELSVAPLRLELDLSIGLGRQGYSIHELHNLEGDGDFPGQIHELYKAMYDEDKLQAEFGRLLEVLIRYGRRFMENDRSLWLDLRNQRKSCAVLLENDRVSKEAENAFKTQRWDEVVRLFEGREKTLDELNKRRLNYAKKKSIRET